MRIKDKINLDLQGLINEGAITIVAFGDSVTHGAFGLGELDYDAVYWNRLRQKILAVRNYVPVNVINSGIGGVTANGSICRVEKQVLAHNPDLIIICFGLNDVNAPLDVYLSSLKAIFEKCNTSDAEVIFMTPNSFNTRVADDTADVHKEYAAVTAKYQNEGKMDLYISSAKKLAEEMGVTVCDCYAEWKKLAETKDVTMLLENRINHPTREMHELFANMLFKTIFGDDFESVKGTVSTMFQGV